MDDSLGFEPRVAFSLLIRTEIQPPGEGGGWKSGRAPTFYYCTLAFTLQLRKNHGKPSVRVVEKRLVNELMLVGGTELLFIPGQRPTACAVIGGLE